MTLHIVHPVAGSQAERVQMFRGGRSLDDCGVRRDWHRVRAREDIRVHEREDVRVLERSCTQADRKSYVCMYVCMHVCMYMYRYIIYACSYIHAVTYIRICG